MRCAACDVLLSDTEAALKNNSTGEYWDMCGTCLNVTKDALTELEDDSEVVYKSSYQSGNRTQTYKSMVE